MYLDRVKRIRYLSPMRAAKVQASLRIRAVSPEPPLLTHTDSESRGTFRQKARSLAPLNGWACTVKMCHDGMLEDTNSLDGAHLHFILDHFCVFIVMVRWNLCKLRGTEKLLTNEFGHTVKQPLSWQCQSNVTLTNQNDCLSVTLPNNKVTWSVDVYGVGSQLVQIGSFKES